MQAYYWAWNQDRRKVILTTHVCYDSIARPAVQGMSQFNAKYGCGCCLQYSPGHYFKYDEAAHNTLRTHAMHVELLGTLNSSEESYGVKHESVMLKLNTMDIIQSKGIMLNTRQQLILTFLSAIRIVDKKVTGIDYYIKYLIYFIF